MASGIIFGCIVPHPPILVPAVGGSESRRVEATARALESLAEEIRALDPEVLL
ncbi:MAG: hypothetical protein HYX89_08000, partial [Chloroflexi bacterium]|nr:hypothetical protein [Chloroflexota bacterium]